MWCGPAAAGVWALPWAAGASAGVFAGGLPWAPAVCAVVPVSGSATRPPGCSSGLVFCWWPAFAAAGCLLSRAALLPRGCSHHLLLARPGLARCGAGLRQLGWALHGQQVGSHRGLTHPPSCQSRAHAIGSAGACPGWPACQFPGCLGPPLWPPAAAAVCCPLPPAALPLLGLLAPPAPLRRDTIGGSTLPQGFMLPPRCVVWRAGGRCAACSCGAGLQLQFAAAAPPCGPPPPPAPCAALVLRWPAACHPLLPAVVPPLLPTCLQVTTSLSSAAHPSRMPRRT
jgi:hypothetical protein